MFPPSPPLPWPVSPDGSTWTTDSLAANYDSRLDATNAAFGGLGFGGQSKEWEQPSAGEEASSTPQAVAASRTPTARRVSYRAPTEDDKSDAESTNNDSVGKARDDTEDNGVRMTKRTAPINIAKEASTETTGPSTSVPGANNAARGGTRMDPKILNAMLSPHQMKHIRRVTRENPDLVQPLLGHAVVRSSTLARLIKEDPQLFNAVLDLKDSTSGGETNVNMEIVKAFTESLYILGFGQFGNSFGISFSNPFGNPLRNPSSKPFGDLLDNLLGNPFGNPYGRPYSHIELPFPDHLDAKYPRGDRALGAFGNFPSTFGTAPWSRPPGIACGGFERTHLHKVGGYGIPPERDHDDSDTDGDGNGVAARSAPAPASSTAHNVPADLKYRTVRDRGAESSGLGSHPALMNEFVARLAALEWTVKSLSAENKELQQIVSRLSFENENMRAR